MVDPIKSGVAPANISKPAPAAAPQAPVQQNTVVQKTDTVQLSDAAQARSLRQQGKSIPEIALQLRLDVKTVNGFFPEST
jgi:hypothetical protein